MRGLQVFIQVNYSTNVLFLAGFMRRVVGFMVMILSPHPSIHMREHSCYSGCVSWKGRWIASEGKAKFIKDVQKMTWLEALLNREYHLTQPVTNAIEFSYLITMCVCFDAWI